MSPVMCVHYHFQNASGSQCTLHSCTDNVPGQLDCAFMCFHICASKQKNVRAAWASSWELQFSKVQFGLLGWGTRERLQLLLWWLHLVPKIRNCFGFGTGSASRWSCVASSLTQTGAVWKRYFFIQVRSHQENNTHM